MTATDVKIEYVAVIFTYVTETELLRIHGYISR
jgi:hypothetical protein